MSKLNRNKNRNIATRAIIEKALQDCACKKRQEGVNLGIDICRTTKTSCKYAIQNGLCETLKRLSETRPKVAI